jgi:hypothetical protein
MTRKILENDKKWLGKERRITSSGTSGTGWTASGGTR